MQRSWVSRPACLAAVVGLIACCGCGGLELASVWADRQVATDGIPTEWEGATTWIEKPNSAIGVMNDGEFLYLCFSSPLKSVAAQVIRQGLTVWFDPEGGKEKTFGVRCPVRFAPGTEGAMTWAGPQGSGQEGNPPANPGRSGSGGSGPGSVPPGGAGPGGPAPAGLGPGALGGPPTTIEVLGPGDDDFVELAPDDAGGIEIMLGNADGRLVCELRVPLRAGAAHPHAIGVTGQGPVGIGFETPEMKVEGMPEGVPEGGFPGGGGGPGGGPGAGPGGGGGDGGGGMGGPGMAPGGSRGRGMGPGGEVAGMERLQIWGKVHLASQES